MKDLAGRTAVVTGAASGIGLAITEAFIAAGVRVAMADINADGLEQQAARLRSSGADVLGVPADVRDPTEVNRVGRETVDHFGELNIAVNNAGIVITGRSWELPLEDWHRVLDVNLWGVIHGVHSFVPLILASGEEGHVVNVASMAAVVAHANLGPYTVAKHGLLGLSDVLRAELHSIGAPVGVSVVMPGMIRTGMNPIGTVEASVVAANVVDAIRTDRSYVFTDDQHVLVGPRLKAILAARTEVIVKAVRAVGGAATVVDLDEPPGIGELLDMKATSVCASDLSYLKYGTTSVLGHELAGVRADGTKVVVEALYGCMECEQCLAGAYNLCPTHGERALGMFADGGMSEQFRAPTARLVDVPAELDLRDASIVEPASVSWHALRLADTRPGRRVAVVGAGALGLLAAAGARRMGAEEVALAARHPHQREAGERIGARIGTEGLYDVVVEAAGSEASLAQCGELVAPGGTIVVLGVHFGAVQLNWMPLFHREARIIPSLGYCATSTGREMEDAAAMLAEEPEIARAVITHRFPLEDAAEAFRVAGDRSAGAIRVVIEP